MEKQDENIDPLLGIPKNQPFIVPEAYFDDFEARLQMRLQQQNQKPETGSKLIKMLNPVMWLAASFLLVLLLVHYPLSKFLPDDISENAVVDEEYPISIESLDEDEFYDIISDDLHAETLDTDDIFDYLSVELSEYEIYTEMYN